MKKKLYTKKRFFFPRMFRESCRRRLGLNPCGKKRVSENSIVNLSPLDAIKLEIQVAGIGRTTYYRESNYYPNGDDRVSELITDDGYKHVISYLSKR